MKIHLNATVYSRSDGHDYEGQKTLEVTPLTELATIEQACHDYAWECEKNYPGKRVSVIARTYTEVTLNK